ncbi:DNA cytosine methyltransferase [Yersinia intermedia]|uniref:DNA cytosine methyltransferase n=1 Tax=Yersinia intermedia TaxID=631 RepID=UPI0025AA66CC|nr:DNA cytosine methyltransferase [Yersinia intermedia]MDN0113188.1 DNA cytosine methyltransferase [Yersinia intermedia]
MNVIDLFAGVGGLSLGASRAGFNVSAAVEIDPYAISTHHLNFPKSRHFKVDVSTLNGEEMLKTLGVSQLDCLIGGPPCQGFSTIGKGDVDDKRNELYHHFFRLVSEMKPICFLAENVPGILNSKYDSIRAKAFQLIEDEYIILPSIKAVASELGAATTRTRIFFIGYRKELGKNVLRLNDFKSNNDFPLIKVKDALYGLPEVINPEWQKEEDGWREIRKERTGYFYDRLWGNIPSSVGELISIANLEKNLVSGCLGTRHSLPVEERYSSLKFGEVDQISKSMRLDPEGFCPTLRAGTASDKGSYQAVRPIHPYESRVITPREAARLQGFPDWFRFHSTKWHSFRQIGNSVSPLVAEVMLLPLAKLCRNVQNTTLENQGIAL